MNGAAVFLQTIFTQGQGIIALAVMCDAGAMNNVQGERSIY